MFVPRGIQPIAVMCRGLPVSPSQVLHALVEAASNCRAAASSSDAPDARAYLPEHSLRDRMPPFRAHTPPTARKRPSAQPAIVSAGAGTHTCAAQARTHRASSHDTTRHDKYAPGRKGRWTSTRMVRTVGLSWGEAHASEPQPVVAWHWQRFRSLPACVSLSSGTTWRRAVAPRNIGTASEALRKSAAGRQARQPRRTPHACSHATSAGHTKHSRAPLFTRDWQVHVSFVPPRYIGARPWSYLEC